MPDTAIAASLMPAVASAAKRLQEGGVIVYPTETFYGLGACLSQPRALERLFTIKGRSDGKPLPVIASDPDQAKALWTEIPDVARVLMHRFWPGPLTIVLPAKAGLSFAVAPGGAVGVRVSSHPVARELARLAGPIAATSANKAGAKERTKVSELDPTLCKDVDAIVDAGATPGGLPSTIVAFQGGKPVILREGAIQRAVLEACF